MTNEQLISEISKKTGLPRVDVEEVIEAYPKVVRNALMRQEKVYCKGFGTYRLKKRNGMTYYNIAEGKKCFMPDKHIPVFVFSPTFSKKVKENIPVLPAP